MQKQGALLLGHGPCCAVQLGRRKQFSFAAYQQKTSVCYLMDLCCVLGIQYLLCCKAAQHVFTYRQKLHVLTMVL